MPLESQRSSRIEDPGAEVLLRATTLWERYGRGVTIGLALVVAVIAVGFFAMRARAGQEERAAAELAEAHVLFWQGDYTRSAEMAKQVGSRYPSTPSGIESHRLAGDNAFWNGDFKSAVTEYRQYLDKVTSGLLADAARRSFAYALDSDGQYAEAAKVYESLVGKLDRASSAEFLVAAARCHRQLGQRGEALTRLNRVLAEFGETSYAQTARIQIAELSAAAG